MTVSFIGESVVELVTLVKLVNLAGCCWAAGAQSAKAAEWILFIVDENGWVMNEDEEYLVPAKNREGTVLVRTRMVDGELVMEAP